MLEGVGQAQTNVGENKNKTEKFSSFPNKFGRKKEEKVPAEIEKKKRATSSYFTCIVLNYRRRWKVRGGFSS